MSAAGLCQNLCLLNFAAGCSNPFPGEIASRIHRVIAARRNEVGHEALFKNTPIHIDSCSVRFVTPGTAISIVTWSKGSFVTPDGKQMPEGKDRMSLFLVKLGGRWLIASGHNTTIIPEAQQYNPNSKE